MNYHPSALNPPSLLDSLFQSTSALQKWVLSQGAPLPAATDNWSRVGISAAPNLLPKQVTAEDFVAKIKNAVLQSRLDDDAATRRLLLEVVPDVIGFYTSIREGYRMPTHASIGADGECVLQWRAADSKAIATFDGSHSYGVVVVSGSNVIPAKEDGKVGAVVPELETFIRNV